MGSIPKSFCHLADWNTGSPWADQSASLLKWDSAEGPPIASVSAKQNGACLLSAAVFCVGEQKPKKGRRGAEDVPQTIECLPGLQNPLGPFPSTAPHKVM